MNINDVDIPQNIDASIDTTKNRAVIHLNGDDGQTIVAYYPAEGLQVYVYKVNGTALPDMWDLGIRTAISDKNLRILICKHGHGEFSKNGVNLNLSGGEFALIYVTKEDNRFLFAADTLIGVEIVLQLDDTENKSVLLRILQSALRYLGLTPADFQENHWYFSRYSQETEKAIDRLIERCMSGSDSALVMINATEIGYCLGNDYENAGSKERKYPTKPQKAIAEDMHRQLTENYGEKATAAMFAEKYGLSDSTVKNYFKNVYGYGFKEYQMKVRMEKAASLLETTDKKQVEIAMTVGYATQAKFISAFKKYYHMTPSEYRRSKKLGDILGQ